VAYRDDLDAAHKRIEALQHELAGARRELGESRALVRMDRRELARAESDRARSRWLGAPTRVGRSRELDVAAPESCYLDIVEYLEEQFEITGRTSTLLGRLEWVTTPPSSGTGPFVTVTVTVTDGKTTVRAEERTTTLAGAIFGGVGGGIGGGAIMAPGALFFVNPVLGAAALPLWLAGVYFSCRRIYKRTVRKRALRIEEAVDDIAEIIERAAARATLAAAGEGGQGGQGGQGDEGTA
jgi:hypothetical protein